MAISIFHVDGRDLDSVFEPRQSGDPTPAATQFLNAGGSDLNALYAPLSVGSAASATQLYTAGGSDLNTVFAAAGTRRYVAGDRNLTCHANGSGSCTNSETYTAYPAGGSYTWSKLSGSGSLSGSGQSVTISYTAGNANTSGVFRCVINGTAVDFTVSFNHSNDL